MILIEIQPLANHLWQSTLFAAVAGLLTLALRKNRAQTRYWLWLAASVKFLVPFSLLVDLGSYFGRRTAPGIALPGISQVIEQVSQPLAAPSTLASIPAVAQTSSVNWIPAALYAVWTIGFAMLVFSWWRRWRRLRAVLHTASPLDLHIGIEVRIPPAFSEPGVFGVRRPVLLLPAGITDRLTPPQLQAILAHEMCHIRRRDNLATSIHMAVEALFWFYPLVWWLGARLMAERERACDEEVLLMGSDPEAYAEGILKICEFYLESPLPCVSGATGANLKKRIEAIMSNRIGIRLNIAKRIGLALAGTAALAAPIVVGMLNAPTLQAQSAVPRPKFEVASIKRCPSEVIPTGGGRGTGGALGGPLMFRTGCVPVRFLIEMAYIRHANGQAGPVSELKKQPLQGGPDWINSDRYAIDAKPAGPQTRVMMAGPMLQALLEDRFKLRIHRESKEVPIYELVVAKGGPKLQPTKEGSCTTDDATQGPPAPKPGQPPPCGSMGGGRNGLDAVGVPIASLCPMISNRLHRAVIDKTGLSGLFDYHLDFNVGPPGGAPGIDDPTAPDPVATVMGALQKLGLKLQPAKGTAEFVVIDHVARPTEN